MSEYLLYFIPDRRLVSHREVGSDRDVNGYSADGGTFKTVAVNKLLVERMTGVHCQKWNLFVVKMNNHISRPKLIPMLSEIRIGCGTARSQSGEPPRKILRTKNCKF